jgi:membrane protein DedA with SNARE-associated domain
LDKQFKAGRFLILNSLGALLWSVAIALGGFLFGAALQILLEDIRHYELEIIIGISLIGFILWAVHRFRGK